MDHAKLMAQALGVPSGFDGGSSEPKQRLLQAMVAFVREGMR